jgi:hypothetical protein
MLGKYTYDAIAELIDKVLTQFDLQNKITLLVTDNTKNFVKAFKYVEYILNVFILN